MDLEEEFRRAYPNLSEELDVSDGLPIEGRRAEGDGALEEEQQEQGEEGDRAPEEDWKPAPIPTVSDHLRRCGTTDEALEIIEFFYEKGEIDGADASLLEERLEEEGLRAFGPKREPGAIEKDGLDR